MSAPREAQVVEAIRREIERRGGYLVKTQPGRGVRAGTPDVLGCVDGRCVAVEAKRPGRESQTTALQRAELEKWRRAGAVVGVVSSAEALADLLDDVDVEAGPS